MIIGQRLQGLCRRVDQALFLEPKRRAPQPGQTFNIAFALVVGNPDAGGAGDNHRPPLFVFLQVGVAMHVIVNVTAGGGVAPVRHGMSSFELAIQPGD